MQTAKEFLATGAKFQLGFLETEKPHPKTRDLSDWAASDLPRAISTLAEIDCHALDVVGSKFESIVELRSEIESVWSNGHRVFLCGCGATGRLSLALECLHKERVAQTGGSSDAGGLVIGFMAGGDVALVHSLEGFEDFPDYGSRHLRELGFRDGDLLISCTEGGETPYVIGATEEAARSSRRNPYFLYCNPDEILCQHVERSRRVIENATIKKINLTVGPMALAGSTRMQASTVLQLSVGLALLTAEWRPAGNRSRRDIREVYDAVLSLLKKYMLQESVRFLSPFIEREASEYLAGRYVMYGVNTYPITVFTDTTERAPTFSLTPFCHRDAERLLKLKPSLCYIYLSEAQLALEAWQKLLGRPPRSLNWQDVDQRTLGRYLEAFDFTEKGARAFRQWRTSGAEHSDFLIGRHDNVLRWEFQDLERGLILPSGLAGGDYPAVESLFAHMLLKMLLNIHSTLIMGRLNRYKRNLMTWVYPTNGKLIDRATRYTRTLLHEDGIEVSYDDTVRALFEVKQKITGNDSVVLATYEYLKTK